MSLLFVDAVCPKAYDLDLASVEALGGTEATVLRIAKALSETQEVFIMQHNRDYEAQEGNIKYITMGSMFPRPTKIVYLRTARHIPVYASLFENAEHFIWMHDLAGPHLVPELPIIQDIKPTMIFVSEFAKTQFIDFVQGVYRNFKFPKLLVINNPVASYCYIEQTLPMKNQVIFISSPHKGLDKAIELFKIIREFHMPELELLIANPGYYASKEIGLIPGITELGQLPHHELMRHVAESHLVFYPNTVFPETFGLVFAEATALGVPVLTHAQGAAREVLQDTNQLVDCNDNKKFIEKCLALINNEYKVDRTKADKFRIERILPKWQELLQ